MTSRNHLRYRIGGYEKPLTDEEVRQAYQQIDNIALGPRGGYQDAKKAMHLLHSEDGERIRSIREVAKIMGCTPAWISVLENYALRRLRWWYSRRK